MGFVKTIVVNKAVFWVQGWSFEINGKTWRVIALDRDKGNWRYTLRSGDQIEERTEKQLIKIHDDQKINIPTVTVSEAVGGR